MVQRQTPAPLGCRAIALARASRRPRCGLKARGLQATAGPSRLLCCTHRHHLVFGFLHQRVAERFSHLLLQRRLDLAIADPAAVLRDQGDQGVGEVGAEGHWGGLGTQALREAKPVTSERT